MSTDDPTLEKPWKVFRPAFWALVLAVLGAIVAVFFVVGAVKGRSAVKPLVWPDWNPNGQFVIYEIPRGETMKAWRGPASSQVKDKEMGLNAHLEGGWDQIIIKPKGSEWDSTRYYMRGGGNGEKLHPPGISRDVWSNFSKEKQKASPIREQINSPNVQGPFDTKWGSTDFDTQLRDAKIGLPSLPGQVSNTLKR